MTRRRLGPLLETVKRRGKVGEDTVSELMFADDFVSLAKTPEGLQKQIDKVLEYTRKWRVTANVSKSAILVCNEDIKNPVELNGSEEKRNCPS